jgi:hypothetical protein
VAAGPIQRVLAQAKRDLDEIERCLPVQRVNGRLTLPRAGVNA